MIVLKIGCMNPIDFTEELIYSKARSLNIQVWN